MIDDALTFIETQLPVSKLSKESYKERKANHGQTLTGLGKWWGRKPLILIRAVILGLLMPASENLQKDREIFLRLLTMDDDGLWRRKNKNLTAAGAWELLTPSERARWFETRNGRPAFKRGLPPEEREGIQKRAFLRMSYDRKLEHCARPEEIDGPGIEAWAAINAHLGTTAASLPELVRQLGERRFGQIPRVGDAFCGGGSIPFEAARLGCHAFGSDLSPVAALLAWAALNIVGGGPEVAQEVRQALEAVYRAVKQQIDTWGIERNEAGWVADAYLYCHEVRDRGWWVPLAPSWVIGERTRTAAVLVPLPQEQRFRIEIYQGLDDEALDRARREGTWDNGVKCPVDEDGAPIPLHLRRVTSADSLRGRAGLRRWENDDLVPRPGDVFQERLYCIRWRLPKLQDLLWEEQRARQGQPDDARPPDVIEREIAALLPFLSPDDQEALCRLRARNWLSENAAAEGRDESSAAPARTGRRQGDGVASRRPPPPAPPPKTGGGETASQPSACVPPPPVFGGGGRGVAAGPAHPFGFMSGPPSTPGHPSAARADWNAAREVGRARDAEVAALSARVPETWYAAPDDKDLRREEMVLTRLRERFASWQAKGHIPSIPVEDGDETGRLPRERGYTYWHHLFNPRQLLTLGLFAQICAEMQFEGPSAVGCLLGIGRLANFNSRLCRWLTNNANEKGQDTFTNQALNTLANFSVRPVPKLDTVWLFGINVQDRLPRSDVRSEDARGDVPESDLWITDPAYADAINYEELSEFFLAWYEKPLQRLFPDWYTDSKRALAVRGSDEGFRQAMVECYRNFACHMSPNGLQIVTFTHTNAEVWADLALVLWAAGLRVTAAWTIATETDASGLKQGNYVQGTVLLVLRRQTGNEWGDLADVFPEVQAEVERQLETMIALDDKETPNFSDSDYQLAAYAAALRALTRYKTIEDIDVEREIRRARRRGDISPLTPVIEKAVKIASDYLVPRGIDRSVWRTLSPEERLYVKGLEVEAHGDYRSGVYMEFARGYGVREYRALLSSAAANQTRLKTPSEFRGSGLSGEGFARSLLRQVLFAIYKTTETGDPSVGRDWLHREIAQYWDRRVAIGALLRYLIDTPTPAMTHWEKDRLAAELLAGLVANDTP